VELTYRFKLWSSDGRLLFSWTVTGTGSKQEGQSTIEFSHGPYVTAVEVAMRDAAMKFLETFQGMPEVRQLLREDKNRASR
jgi:hypothetical protein